MKFIYIILLIVSIIFISCNPLELKPLDVKTVKTERITARWFQTSSITTVHNHVEIKTNRGWVQVLEADGNGEYIYDVLINQDTVIIQSVKNMSIYHLTTIYGGIRVKLDTSITTYQYMKKFNPDHAKYYRNL